MALERQIKSSPLRGQSRAAWRGSWLLASTALSAVLAHAAPARAQSLSSTATPQGGVVVGGNASITQATGSTTITQSSDRAAINWQSYNVGSNAQVTYVQPSSSAVTLNRVVSPDPSVIAGHISANGQLVLINQSGVVFTKGAEVNAQAILVSTSNISDSDFMAGKMAFTGTPNPGAKIVNDGKLTAGQAGLVGLVAPQVANNGIITARLGQVVLAGADAFTLDLYGDRLISLDVTKAVTQVDLKGKIVPALVTNKGLILADGGKITLTAADADGLISQLLQVGGTLRANSAEGQSGSISLQAVGGGINIAGNLLAQGHAVASSGGKIEAVASGTVAVAPHAVIDASGQAGGGTIALGTDLARAAQGASDTTAPRAAAVSIAAGAQIKANAVTKGDGGKVTMLSSQSTALQGTISTTGGTLGGNGGLVEISSDGVISLGGTVYDTAINGQAGEILLDPQTLIVTSASLTNANSNSSGPFNNPTTTLGDTSSSPTTSYVNPDDLALLNGTIVLEAAKLLSVASAINLNFADELKLVSNKNVSITADISAQGSIEIDAAGTLNVGASLSGTTITLADSGSSSVIDINGVISGTELILNAGGSIAEGASGGISATSLTGAAFGDALLSNGGNTIGTLADFSAGGTLALTDEGALSQTGSVSASAVTLSATAMNLSGNVSASSALELASSGTLVQSGSLTGTDISLSGSSLGLNGSITATTATLAATGAINQAGSAGLAAASLSGSAGASIALGGHNSIAALGSLSAAGDIAIESVATMTLNGPVSAGTSLALVTAGLLEGTGGSLAAGTIAIAPYNAGTLDLGGTAVAGLQLA
ncbi:two-partner secretion domain-containing protein, partial [Acidocella facilis]|uniref:two-partner secretion domain-containing protein n=1 Tax=Acidocella facilis TaxID=525 RepID=UPI00047CB4F3